MNLHKQIKDLEDAAGRLRKIAGHLRTQKDWVSSARVESEAASLILQIVEIKERNNV